MSETMSVRNACGCGFKVIESGSSTVLRAGAADGFAYAASSHGLVSSMDTGRALFNRVRWMGSSGNDAAIIGYNGPLAEYLVPSLVRALGDSRPEARASAAKMLGEMGRSAADAVPALVKALGDPSVEVRVAAAWALGEIGYGSRQALDALVARMTDTGESREVRNAAGEAVRKISLTMSCTS